MKAAVLHGREDVRIEEIEPKPLRPGEVRVKIECALTCGTDLKVFKRGYHAKMIVPPAVFGHEMAGTISELGPGVTGWALEERVVVANSAPCDACPPCQRGQENLCDDLQFLNGAYAESIVVPERLVRKNLLRLSPELDFRDAALTEPLACVVHGFDECAAATNDRILIVGSGPIGLMFSVLAASQGCEVTLAGRGEERLNRARELGVRRIVDMTGRDDLEAEVERQADPPFDRVIEAVGQPRAWEASTRLARKGGLVNFFGGCPAGATATIDTGLIHYSSLTLRASFHHTPRAIRRALQWIESGAVRASKFVDGEAPLSGLPQLFNAMARGNRAVKTAIRADL